MGGGGGYTNRPTVGGVCQVLPLQKGGTEKILVMKDRVQEVLR